MSIVLDSQLVGAENWKKCLLKVVEEGGIHKKLSSWKQHHELQWVWLHLASKFSHQSLIAFVVGLTSSLIQRLSVTT